MFFTSFFRLETFKSKLKGESNYDLSTTAAVEYRTI